MNAVLLRKVQGKLTACLRQGWLSAIAVPRGGGLSSLVLGLCLLMLPVLAVLAIATMFITGAHAPEFASGTPMAFGLAGITITSKTRSDLDKIIKDAETIEAKFKGKDMPEDEGKKLEQLYQEGEDLSKALNEQAEREAKMKRMKGAQKYLDTVEDPALPGGDPEVKASREIAGYITPGDLAVLSESYHNFVKRGCPKGAVASVELKGSLLPVRGRPERGALIALTENEVKSVSEMLSRFETKDLPELGTGVIAPNRVDRFVQDTRPATLTLRDILNVSPTSSPVIQYIAEVSYASGAAVQSEGQTAATTAVKGEDDVEYELREETVKTIASTIPVSEQQLSDAPALINRINTRLIHGLRNKEEQMCGYGTGGALSFAGFFDNGTGIDDADDRSVVGDSLIDIIRRGITDVMTDEYAPNGVWIHPIDWEAIELEKGSDGHYIWAIIRDLLGARIWSVRVVQGVGTKKAGNTTRNLLIGDFQNGATLYDKEQTNIAIGWVDDQFARNLRTIRGEMRSVLAVEAAKAFRKYQTAA